MADALSFSVMTFNLRFGLADDGPNAWENRKKAYPALFQRYQPDFIGFQEANNFQTEYLATLLDQYGFIGKRTPSPDFWQNNLIFHSKKWVCKEKRHCFLSETPDVESRLENSRWPRQCTLGLFEQGAARVVMANTHFDFYESVQKRSAELVVDFLSEFPRDLPTIVTGDFNCIPLEPAHDVFTQNGFEDAFTGGHTCTFHGFTGKDRGGHIDWILSRGRVKVCRKEIVRDQFSGFYPSDHFPVLVEFTIAPSPA